MNASLCFLGAGKINRKHARLLKKLYPDLKLAVASREPAKAEAFCKELGLNHAFSSYDVALLSNYSAIVIGTPPKLHYEWSKKALAAGKDLIIEKPIFDSLAQFQELWPQLNQDANLVLVAENQHFDPLHTKIIGLLRDQDWGVPISLEVTRLGRSSPAGWRASAEEMPLGALHEGGIHYIRRLLDLATVFEKTPGAGVLALQAFTPKQRLIEVPGEDTMMVVARHRSGLVSRLFHSWGIPKRSGLLDLSKIVTEKGAIYFDVRGAIGLSLHAKRKKILWPPLEDFGGYRAMWKHFIACLETRTPCDLGLQDCFEDFAYMDAAYRSLHSQREEGLAPLKF